MRHALLSLALLAATGCSLMIDPDGVEPKVPGSVTALSVTPSNPWIPMGLPQPLTAIAFRGSSPSDVSTTAVWSTSNSAVASISALGVVTPVGGGSATITATYGGLSATALVTVVTDPLNAIAVTPATSTLAGGATVQLKATATFGVSTTADVTEQATWSTGAAALSVSNYPGSKGLVTAQQPGTETVTAALGTKSGTASVTVKELTSIAVTPATPTVAKGLDQQFVATASYSDSSTAVVTSSVSWSSSATSIATINSAGLATTILKGSTTISASLGGVSGSTTLTVGDPTLASLAVTPAPISIAKGSHQQLTVTGTYTDGSKQVLASGVTFSVAAPTVAAVGSAATDQGVLKALEVGSTTVTASYGGKTSPAVGVTVGSPAIVKLEVALEVTSDKMPPGTRVRPSSVALQPDPLQAVATVTYTDGRSLDVTPLASWSSSDPTVLTVSNVVPTRGLITTKAGGSTNLIATFGGTTVTVPVTVHAPILMWVAPFPAAIDIPLGPAPFSFKAWAILDDWSTVDVTSSVSWSTSNGGVATVASGGALTGVAAGSAVITATHAATGVAGSAVVFVTSATRQNLYLVPNPITARIGEGTRVRALADYSDGRTFDLQSAATWNSSDRTVIDVSWEGELTAKKSSGSATISVTFGGGAASAPATIGLDWAQCDGAPPIPVGTSVQLRAYTTNWNTGERIDVTDALDWTSDNTLAATVSNTSPTKGLVTGVNAGYGGANIRMAWGGNSQPIWVKVTGSAVTGVTLSPSTTPIKAPIGGTMQFTATAIYGDGSTADVTRFAAWANGGSTAVSFDAAASGRMTTLAAGTAYVTAAFNGQTSSQVQVDVQASQVVSVAVSPATTSVPAGTSLTLKSTATLQNASTIDITPFAYWWALDEAILRTSTPGAFTGLKAGSTQVAAAFGSAIGLADVDVTAVAATTLEMSGPSPAVYDGNQGQLRASASMTDGKFVDVTEQATWGSNTPSIATVSTAAGSRGLVTGVAAGSAVITATYGGLTQSLTVTVGSALSVTSITISPNPVTVDAGGTVALTVTGSGVNFAPVANWSSSNGSNADVGNTPGQKGIVSGFVPGSNVATITATYGGRTATATVNVVAPTMGVPVLRYVEWWDGSQASAPCLYGNNWGTTWPTGYDVQFFACSMASSGRVYDVTELSAWSATSVPAGALAASDAAGSKGRVTTLAQTTTGTVQATYGAATPGTLNVGVSNATLQAIYSDGGPGYTHLGGGDIFGVAAIQVQAAYTDGRNQSMTRFAKVTSEDASVVAVGGLDWQGRRSVTGRSVGSAAIDLEYGAKKTVVSIRVDDRPYLQLRATFGDATDLLWAVAGLQEFEPWKSLPVGMPARVSLLASDAIGIPWSAAEQATWTSSDPAVASVSNAAGSKGLVNALAPGYATISATVDGLTATVDLEVNVASLTSFAVLPSYDLGPKGVVIGPFQAKATYSDGTSFDVTDFVTWPTGMYTAPQSIPGTYKITDTGLSTLSVLHGGTTASFRVVGY
jgi:uncharacterized protein YjdB